MKMLHEKHRPRSWGEVVGQPKAVAQMQAIESRGGFGGRVCWITGPTGTGKTTLCRIAARTVADPHNIVEFDTPDAMDAEAMRLIQDATTYFGLGTRPGRAIIVNEAHRMTDKQIALWLGITERIPDHVAFFFTTTWAGQEKLADERIDFAPLLGRCVEIKLTNQGFAKPMAERLASIAVAEGFGEIPVAKCLKIMEEARNSARRALSLLEAGALA